MRLVIAAAFACGLSSSVADAQSFQAACKVHTLCPGVERGGGRVIACLRDHKQTLSTVCRLAIADFFLNKRGRGEGSEDGSGPRRFDRDDPGAGRDAYAPGPGDRDERDAPPRGPQGAGDPRDRPRGDAGNGAGEGADGGRYAEPGPDARDLPPDDPDQGPSRR